eukprot:SAG22_NODE_2938_length_2089_cov_2.106030_2_plen_89_part_00
MNPGEFIWVLTPLLTLHTPFNRSTMTVVSHQTSLVQLYMTVTCPWRPPARRVDTAVDGHDRATDASLSNPDYDLPYLALASTWRHVLL